MIQMLLCWNNLFCHMQNVETQSQMNQSVVKYYEAGKSCYVNGTFYTKCEESNGIK